MHWNGNDNTVTLVNSSSTLTMCKVHTLVYTMLLFCCEIKEKYVDFIVFQLIYYSNKNKVLFESNYTINTINKLNMFLFFIFFKVHIFVISNPCQAD